MPTDPLLGHCAMELRRYDRIEATFQPRRTDDLGEGWHERIGQRWLWEVSWQAGEDYPGGRYDGEWVCHIVERPGDPHEAFGWVPSGDLVDIELVKRLDVD